MFKGYITFSHNVNDTELIFDLEKNYENIKQILVYNSELFHVNWDFYNSFVYKVTETQYIVKRIYQVIDPGITKIVSAVNTEGKFFEIKTPISDQYWKPKLESIKSQRNIVKDKRKVLKKVKDTLDSMIL
jgi:putative transposase